MSTTTAVIPQQYTYRQLLELKPETAEKIKEWWSIVCWDGDYWSESVIDLAKEDGYALGFVIDDIYWSGFWSQGDGACWTGQVYISQWLKTHCKDSIGLSAWVELIREGVIDKHISVGHVGRYYHENSMAFGYIEDNTDVFSREGDVMTTESIFQSMTIANVFDLIEASDFEYKTTEGIREAIIKSGQDFAQDIYRKLEKEYDYVMSEANLIEVCECNEWLFNAEGERV